MRKKSCQIEGKIQLAHLEQLLHLMLGRTIGVKNLRRRAQIRVAAVAGGKAEVGAKALDVELA